ncbi:unnamed protein product [Rotaria magnacalcarata]|uniref:Protein kinase domain-containing protein n=1 Tax=Rotaria magnacalcarata TaxID=392030 RepID=A0A816U3X4_9BILA|nr:unnamed protein product [Rotaria magnacalcarata]CAF2098299.1 unnamed protein product [Rotaria magnacalcarata]CAF3802712.1 unnamed protein product [Rotaria magnacalcarata]CAF3814782.1 unnamed protein product [Rotaria magnacalcarata]
MELCTRGSLIDVITNDHSLPLYRKLILGRHIAAGMRRIHEHQMIHRDIRPANILVDDEYIAKIGDMGIARVLDPRGCHTQIGCLQYMPPEFYQGSINQKLDIFTYGLTLYHLFTGYYHEYDSRNHRIHLNLTLPVLGDIVSRCCQSAANQRPSAFELERTLMLYERGFLELVVNKQSSYENMNKNQQDRLFVEFCHSFRPHAAQFARRNGFL